MHLAQRAPSRQASYTRTGCPVLVVPSRELPIFHIKTPILIPLTPNSTPKLILVIAKIKRHSKQQQTSDYNTNSSQNHHLVHFHQQPPYFIIFHSHFKTTTPIQSPSTHKHKQTLMK